MLLCIHVAIIAVLLAPCVKHPWKHGLPELPKFFEGRRSKSPARIVLWELVIVLMSLLIWPFFLVYVCLSCVLRFLRCMPKKKPTHPADEEDLVPGPCSWSLVSVPDPLSQSLSQSRALGPWFLSVVSGPGSLAPRPMVLAPGPWSLVLPGQWALVSNPSPWSLVLVPGPCGLLPALVPGSWSQVPGSWSQVPGPRSLIPVPWSLVPVPGSWSLVLVPVLGPSPWSLVHCP